MEVAVEPWIEGLWPALKKHLNGSLQNDDISDNSILHDHRDTSQNGHNNYLQNSVPSVPSSLNMTTRTEKAIESAIDQQLTDRNTSDNNSNSQQIYKRINAGEGNVEEKVPDEITEVSNSLNKLSVTDQSASVNTLTANNDVILKKGDQSSASCDLGIKIDDQSKGCEVNSNRSCDSYGVIDQLCDSSVSSSPVASIQQSISPLCDSNLSVPVLSPAYLKINYNADEALVSITWLALKKKIMGSLDKSLKIKSLIFSVGINIVYRDLNQYKSVVPLFGAAYAAPNKGTTVLCKFSKFKQVM